MNKKKTTSKLALVLFLTTVVVNTPVMAKDSIWKLCKGSFTTSNELNEANTYPILVNLFEHRNSNGDGRETDLTLIYGGNVLSGTFDSTEKDSGKIILKKSNTDFTGNISIDYVTESMNLKGKLNLLNFKTLLQTELKCETILN